MNTVYVRVSNDYTRLGEAATEQDLDNYTTNLARLVAREFGCTAEVDTDCVNSTQVTCSNDGLRERVEERVREIESSDEWVAMIDAPSDEEPSPTATNSAVLETIDSYRKFSALAWEGAADGAERDGHDRAPVEAAAEECDGHYEAAEEAIRGGNLDGAIAALEWAASLEREWGDAQHAERALDAVRSVASVGVYSACISDGMSRDGGGTTRLSAKTLDAAIAEAEEWAHDGDYTTEDGGDVSVTVVIMRGSEVVSERTVVCTSTAAEVAS